MERILVVAGVMKKDGKIMAYQRPEGKELAGKWEFPGGKLEAGESPETALGRELMEELGVHVRVGKVLDVLRRADQGRDVLLMFYACETDEQPQPLEHGHIRFLDKTELLLLDFAPMDRLFLQRGGLERT